MSADKLIRGSLAWQLYTLLVSGTNCAINVDAQGRIVVSSTASGGAGGAPNWGEIVGTLADQADLESALDGKAALSHNHDAAYEPLGEVAALASSVATALAGKSDTSHNHDAAYAAIDHTHPGGGGAGQLVVPMHADGGANCTLTNQANAEQFLGNSSRNIARVDLSGYTQYRLVARVVTASASVNNARIYAQFHASYTNNPTTFSPLGASGDIELSLAVAGYVDTPWTDLAAGAIGDVFVAVLQNGGDAALDPALGNVLLQFR